MPTPVPTPLSPLGGAPSSLRRPRVVALLGVAEQRLLDRVGQPEAAVAREPVEPRLPFRRALQGDDRLARRPRPLGTARPPPLKIRHRPTTPSEEGARRGRSVGPP